MIRVRIDHDPKRSGFELHISPAAWAAIRTAIIDGATKALTKPGGVALR